MSSLLHDIVTFICLCIFTICKYKYFIFSIKVMILGNIIEMDNYRFFNTHGCVANMKDFNSPQIITILSSDPSICTTLSMAQHNNRLLEAEVYFLANPPPPPTGQYWTFPPHIVISAMIKNCP